MDSFPLPWTGNEATVKDVQKSKMMVPSSTSTTPVHKVVKEVTTPSSSKSVKKESVVEAEKVEPSPSGRPFRTSRNVAMSLMKGSLVDDVDSTFLEALSPEQQIKVSEQKCPFCSKKYVYKSNFKKHLLEGCDTVDVVDEAVSVKSPLVPPKNAKRKTSTNAATPKTSKIKRVAKSPSKEKKVAPVPLSENSDVKDITTDIIADVTDMTDVTATNDIDANESETRGDNVDNVDNVHTASKLNDSSSTVHLSNVKMEEGVDALIAEENPQQPNCEIIPDSTNSLNEVDNGRNNSTATVNRTRLGHQPLEVIICQITCNTDDYTYSCLVRYRVLIMEFLAKL